MEHHPTTLDAYLQREHAHAAGTILNAIDDDGVTYGQALTAMRHLHYEGWHRRHEISFYDRDKADELPAGTLIRTRTDEYRISYYRDDRPGEIWWKKLNGEHHGAPSRVLEYPITVLDTP